MRAALHTPPAGIYLNTAAESLYLRSHDQAMAEYARHKARGSDGRHGLSEIEESARAGFAGLLGVDAHDVAFVASTSRGLDAAIRSIAWVPGDNIVLGDSEFPSSLFSAALLEQSGVAARIVGYRDGALHEADLIDAIDDDTRLVVVSLVSFKTGQRMDVARIVQAAHARSALVFVDAIQGLGAIEVAPEGADFVCAATFKWMLGAHGLAALYVDPRVAALTRAPYVGYRSVSELFPADVRSFELHEDARRYEEGMPNLLGLCVLDNALRVIQDVGISEIAQHDAQLVDRLRAGIRSLGFDPLCPDDATPRASIVAFETPHYDGIGNGLAARGTTVWARDGRVRLAPHIYNTTADIDTVLQQLSELTAGRR
jgi:selenocysteine lyase/cysteine desulfurase